MQVKLFFFLRKNLQSISIARQEINCNLLQLQRKKKIEDSCDSEKEGKSKFLQFQRKKEIKLFCNFFTFHKNVTRKNELSIVL